MRCVLPLIKAIISIAVVAACSKVEVAFAQFEPPPAIVDAAQLTTQFNQFANKPPQTEALQLEQLHQANQVRENATNFLAPCGASES